MDRTGEVSGSYYMNQLGWSFSQALTYDDKCIEGRNITIYSQNSLQWYVSFEFDLMWLRSHFLVFIFTNFYTRYCYNLKYTQNAQRDCSIPAQWSPEDCHVRKQLKSRY
jgi:hypothetical protein